MGGRNGAVRGRGRDDGGRAAPRHRTKRMDTRRCGVSGCLALREGERERERVRERGGASGCDGVERDQLSQSHRRKATAVIGEAAASCQSLFCVALRCSALLSTAHRRTAFAFHMNPKGIAGPPSRKFKIQIKKRKKKQKGKAILDNRRWMMLITTMHGAGCTSGAVLHGPNAASFRCAKPIFFASRTIGCRVSLHTKGSLPP